MPNLITKCFIAMVCDISGGLTSQPKKRKYLKLRDVQPVLWVYKGLLVILREGCGDFGEWRLMICDLGFKIFERSKVFNFEEQVIF